MQIALTCSRCGYRFDVPAGEAGGQRGCPRCRQVVVVPFPATVRVAGNQPGPPSAKPQGAPSSWGECILCSAKQPVTTGDLRAARCVTCGGELVPIAPPPGAPAAQLSPPAPGPRASAAPPDVEKARADPRNRLGPFVLLNELGRGGMGVVHRVWHDGLRHHMALKQLLPEQVPTKEAIQRFQREAHAVARLRHPHIVSVHDVGEIGGRHYLAMDFVAGRTLKQRLDANQTEKLSFDGALTVVRDVARAVQHAHEQGVIHRDLKPHNIIVDSKDKGLVLDFGLARLRDAKTKLTQTGATMGTPAYMPPEQIGGGDAEVDARSDVYSLGATLYYVLASRAPFDGGSDLATMAAVLNKEPSPPSAANARAKGDLDTICLRCLEKEPHRRYGSAGELADELDRHLAGEPILARPIGRLERLVRRARRSKVAAGLLALVVGLSVVVGVLVTDKARQAEADARRRADDEREAIEELGKRASERAEHRRVIEAVLGEARGGQLTGKLDAFDRALNRLTAHRELQTVELLVAALDAERERLREALASVLLEAGEGIDGLPDMLRSIDRLPTGGDDTTPVARALARLADREGQQAIGGQRLRDRVVRRVAAAQGKELGAAGVDVVRLAADALGKLAGTGDGATSRAALDRYLLLEQDEVRATPVGRALALLGADEGDPALTDARHRFGAAGVFWSAVAPNLSRRASEPAPVEDVDGAVERGRAALDRDQLDEALAALDEAIRLAPERAEAWRYRGIARARKGHPKLAIADFEEAVKLAPQSAEIRFDLAQTRRDGDGDLDVALADVRAGLELDPSSATGWGCLGIVLETRGDVPGALEAYDQALARSPDSAKLLANRADLRANGADLDGALADAERAIGLDPRIGLAHQALAKVLLARRQPDLALAAADRAVELAPKGDADALFTRGRVRLVRLDAEGALTDFSVACELEPSPRTFQARGMARQHAGDLQGARQDFDEALRRDPLQTDALVSRGVLRGMEQDLEGAERDLSAALLQNPAYADAWANRAHFRQEREDLEGALSDLARAVELAPRSALMWTNLADVRLRLGDLEGAIRDASTALELDHRYAEAWGIRGDARSARGEREPALADCERGVSLDPNDVFVLLHRATVRGRLGDVQGALKDYARVLEIQPRRPTTWLERGRFKLEHGDPRGGVADLKRFLELAPRDPRAADAQSAIAAREGK